MNVCINCIHVKDVEYWSYDGGGSSPSREFRCFHPLTQVVDKVDGTISQKNCRVIRWSRGMCKPEGILYVENLGEVVQSNLCKSTFWLDLFNRFTPNEVK